MSEKLHNLLRTLQWLIPAVVTFYSVLDKTFGWGLASTVVTIATALVTLIGVIVEHDSKQFFSNKYIVEEMDEGVDE